MKFPLPLFHFRERSEQHDEEVLAEASELAHLRLEQCMADQQSRLLPEWKPLSSSHGQRGAGNERETRRQPTAASLR